MTKLQDLREALNQFDEGDLLAAADIREQAESLQKEAENTEIEALLGDTVELFEEMILQGIQEEQEERLSKIRKQLDALVGEGESEDETADTGSEGGESAESAEEEAGESSGEKSDAEETPAAGEGTEVEESVAGEGTIVHIEDPEILFSFLLEAKDHLDDIEERILELEKEYDDQLVHDIFRSMHTIKGVSSFIGVEHVKSLAHNLENLLNSLRNEEIEFEDELIDILLAGSDALTKMVYDLDEQGQSLEKGKEADVYDGRIPVEELLGRMQPYLDKIEGKTGGGGESAGGAAGGAETAEESGQASGAGAAAGGVEETAAPSEAAVEQGGEAAAAAKEAALKSGAGEETRSAEGVSGGAGKEAQPAAEKQEQGESGGGYEDLVSNEMVQKFVEESSDLVDTAENSILELEKDPTQIKNVEEAFRSVHTVKGNAGFFGFAGIEKMCMGVEGILDSLRKGNRKADGNVISLILESLDGLNVTLQKVQKGEVSPTTGEETSTSAQKAMESKDQGDYKPLGDMLVEMGIASEEAVNQALDMQRMKLGELLVNTGEAKEEEVSKALEKQGKEPQKTEQSSGYRMKRKDIRVDTERLDNLFDLMGELITAEAMVINNPDLEEVDTPNFDRSANYLSKISREMQEITMSIRMVPLEGLFSKMRRLVRDLSKKFDKPINLVISGENTEMDRNVMDEISDPLVHIIRNSLDHGVEDKAKRQERGKAEEGIIKLSAGYEGNEIWITVSDDGGGLNREKIVQKAIEREVLTGNPDDLTDEDVWKLIFEPGFSTADQVSEVSGRGVGMDVVKKNIEKLRGRIDVRSVEGQGSTFILRIPLTLAIIDAINFTVGPQLYSLPITDVLQFHKASKKEVTRTEASGEVINLRSEMIPLVKLHDFFHIGDKTPEVEDGIVMVVQARDRKLAVVVDEIIGYRQVVIKALPTVMEDIRALSGCSILADGKVSLIIDTNSLIGYVLE